MAKYSKYIELRPGYESVVDLRSEERNPNLWQEYIVHEDMHHGTEQGIGRCGAGGISGDEGGRARARCDASCGDP